MTLPLFVKDTFASTRTLVALLIIAALALIALSLTQRSVFVSSEYKFTDASASGLSIVPASCPSSPHYAGECDTANPAPLACSISSSAWVITSGQVAVLSWSGPQGTNAFGMPVTYVSGNITSIGSVPQSGSQSVLPTQTTVYRYTGTQRIAWFFNSAFECDATITVLPSCATGQTLGADGLCHASACPSGQTIGGDGICHATVCASGQILGVDGLCHSSGCPGSYNYCGTGAASANLYQRSYSDAPACSPLNALVATCRYGCSAGSCGASAAQPSATLNVAPSLVQRGGTAQVSWFSTDISSPSNPALGSCTVTGTNGDTWSGLSGSQTSSAITQQTKYTLSCTPYSSTVPITQTVTVNIVPVFQEQ